jgi:ATP-dependent Zn protease
MSETEPMTNQAPEQKDKPGLDAIAYHEAGHAVIAFTLGRKFKKVTIDNGHGELEGYQRKTKDLFGQPYYKTLKNFEPDILISLAGHFAHRRYDPKSVDIENSNEDMDIAITLNRMITISRVCDIGKSITSDNIDDLSKKLVNVYLRKSQDEIEILLNSPAVWGMVESVARALLEKKTLLWRDVKDIIDSKGSPNNFPDPD